MRMALIADVHGNRWALEAVLEDIERERCDIVANLGDSVWGPLDPRGTADILMNLPGPSVRGNQDRVLVEPGDGERDPVGWQFVARALRPDQVAWFGWLRDTEVSCGIHLFHGTPMSDRSYLLETVEAGHCRLRDDAAIEADLAGVSVTIIACAHSHVQRVVVTSGGRLCVNPGSVGLPAFSSDDPAPHVVEAGSPHARYMIMESDGGTWRPRPRLVRYDWDTAARAAVANDRPDWAHALRTGRSR